MVYHGDRNLEAISFEVRSHWYKSHQQRLGLLGAHVFLLVSDLQRYCATGTRGGSIQCHICWIHHSKLGSQWSRCRAWECIVSSSDYQLCRKCVATDLSANCTFDSIHRLCRGGLYRRNRATVADKRGRSLSLLKMTGQSDDTSITIWSTGPFLTYVPCYALSNAFLTF